MEREDANLQSQYNAQPIHAVPHHVIQHLDVPNHPSLAQQETSATKEDVYKELDVNSDPTSHNVPIMDLVPSVQPVEDAQ
jgi:hypothetical protein